MVVSGGKRAMSDQRRVPTIWDERYCTAAAPTNSTTKQVEVVREATASNLLDLRPWAFNESLAWASITSVHDAAFVRAVRTGEPRGLAESQGFTWSPAFADALARIWSGHAAACRLAFEAGIVLHPVSGAHHAGRSRGSGFCTFNFLVGAGRTVLDEGAAGRVAIVDLDAHQGDGTWELAAGDRRFGIFDVAGQDWIGERDTDRVSMAVVESAEAYAAHLARLPAFLDRFEPKLVQYQAGMDCHQDDPVGGIPGVDAEFLSWRDRFVIGEIARRRIPLVINLAGGYQRDGTTVALHVETVRIAARVHFV
jgi:acetoin utilization deacetylase AcuC-like enzyme